MTLLIAFILMNHIGGFEAYVYWSTVTLWCIHCI